MTLVMLPTGIVATAKLGEAVVPAGTGTGLGGGTTAGLLLVKVTSAPPAGAGPSSVTTPIVTLPPFTGLGLNVSSFGLGANTLMTCAIWVGPYVAVSVRLVSAG